MFVIELPILAKYINQWICASFPQPAFTDVQ